MTPDRKEQQSDFCQEDGPSDQGAPSLDGLVAGLLGQTHLSQRELTTRSGLSKDQISRTLAGKRPARLSDVMALLTAAGMPARGAMTLALFNRNDLAIEWSSCGLTAFLEAMIEALPGALVEQLGDDLDRVNPRWGAYAASLVARRLALHVQELAERERSLGEFELSRSGLLAR